MNANYVDRSHFINKVLVSFKKEETICLYTDSAVCTVKFCELQTVL